MSAGGDNFGFFGTEQRRDCRSPSAASSPASPASGLATEIGRLPLVVAIRPWERGSEAEIHFDPQTDNFLLHHKLRGKPLLPAVVGLEALAEAATLATGRRVVAIRNVELIEGLLFHGDKPLVARVRVVPNGNELTCELVSDFFNRSGQLMKKDRVHLRARVDVADSVPPLGIAMPGPPSDFQPFTFQDNGPLYHGPTLHGVKGAIFDAEGGWGQLVALSLAELGGNRTGHDWLVPATLVDAGFYVCGIHTWYHLGQSFSLPASIESVRVARMPRENEACLMAFRCRQVAPPHAVYDFALFGEDREAIALVEGHQVVVIKP